MGRFIRQQRYTQIENLNSTPIKVSTKRPSEGVKVLYYRLLASFFGSLLSSLISVSVNYARTPDGLVMSSHWITLLSSLFVTLLSGVVAFFAVGRGASLRTYFAAGVLSGFALPFLFRLILDPPVPGMMRDS